MADYFPYNSRQILEAYVSGYFPTLDTNGEFFLYSPASRALLPVSGIHQDHSLKRTLKKNLFNVTFDKEFSRVIELCTREKDNWITPELMRVYNDIHKEGWAESVEVWDGNELVGGLYGLAIGSVFFIESAFSLKRDASKVAKYNLIENLRSRGFTLVDVQMNSEFLSSLGAYELEGDDFLWRLKAAVSTTLDTSKNVYQLREIASCPHLYTKRLVIRRLEQEDAENYAACYANPDVISYMFEEVPRSILDALKKIEDAQQRRYSVGIPDPLAICKIEKPDEMIGSIGAFYPIHRLPMMEFAYDLRYEDWGKGYATEASEAMVNYLFEHFPVERIQSRCAVQNKASARLLDKLGFQREGLLRKVMYWKGSFYDLFYYSLLREDARVSLKSI